MPRQAQRKFKIIDGSNETDYFLFASAFMQKYVRGFPGMQERHIHYPFI
jgi:hypothetical protein